MRFAFAGLLILVTCALSGCAAVGLTVATVGAGAFTAGAKEAMQAGSAYAKGGVVYRTFTLPLADVRVAVGDTLARMELGVVGDEEDDDGVRKIEARTRQHAIEMRLEPVTRTVTRVRLVVSEGWFRKDRATASEIVAQLERAVDGQGATSSSRKPPNPWAAF